MRSILGKFGLRNNKLVGFNKGIVLPHRPIFRRSRLAQGAQNEDFVGHEKWFQKHSWKPILDAEERILLVSLFQYPTLIVREF